MASLDRWYQAHLGQLAVLAPWAPWVALALALLAALLLCRWGRRLVGALVLLAGCALALASQAGFERWREHIGAGRLDVLAEMVRRPSDPWPQPAGHIPLGQPWMRGEDRAWVEPAGSFSPAFNSVGLSIWVRGRDGSLLATSDTLRGDGVIARFRPDASGALAVAVATPHYRVSWTTEVDGSFGLRVDALTLPEGGSAELVIRSVGPSGGALRLIARQEDRVLVGENWRVDGLATGQRFDAGDECEPLWMQGAWRGREHAEVESGWAFARIGPLAMGQVVHVRRVNPLPVPDRRAEPASARIQMSGLPDDFSGALTDQVIALKQGLIAGQTRPGDPLNYPLEWLRDASYVITALARSGEVALARQLALGIVARDYFGGFGAEADSLGLALWMLDEVDRVAPSPDWASQVWPHIARKAASLVELSTVDRRHVAAFDGPVVPAHRHSPELGLVSEGLRAGLIVGRMDWQRPLFFVNASAYGGLAASAAMADRLGHGAEARRWRQQAGALRSAWRRALTDPAFAEDANNVRTAISGLWPFDVADLEPYRAVMERQWTQKLQATPDAAVRPSVWTYFDLAQAHQWLRLGRPERSHLVLEALWRMSPMPGLHTFAEGRSEENSFGLWRQARGWVKPPVVTPHYWSAAEALLLQIAMLAESHADDSGGQVLVIGGGVKREWLTSAIQVSQVGTGLGWVTWDWDGHKVRVRLSGSLPEQVVLGTAFPPGTPLEVATAD